MLFSSVFTIEHDTPRVQPGQRPDFEKFATDSLGQILVSSPACPLAWSRLGVSRRVQSGGVNSRVVPVAGFGNGVSVNETLRFSDEGVPRLGERQQSGSCPVAFPVGSSWLLAVDLVSPSGKYGFATESLHQTLRKNTVPPLHGALPCLTWSASRNPASLPMTLMFQLGNLLVQPVNATFEAVRLACLGGSSSSTPTTSCSPTCAP